MPRIDPSQLLDCLGVLLDEKGGIRGSGEVKRLTSLMAKFSKKLVSKCIYVLILQNTKTDLLIEFMSEGGWALVFQWLDDAIVSNNHSFTQQILRLLLLCPISLDRLKQNNCPKVVKGLSKDSDNDVVKQLAGQLVDQWLRFIKSGQAAITEATTVQQAPTPGSAPAATPAPAPAPAKPAPPPAAAPAPSAKAPLTASMQSSGVVISRRKTPHVIRESPSDEEEDDDDDDVPPVGSLPLYKITVRDGKSVLAKVGTKTSSLMHKPTARVTGVPLDKPVEKKLSAKIAELGKIPRIAKRESSDSVKVKTLPDVKSSHSGSTSKEGKPRERSGSSGASTSSSSSKSSHKERDRERERREKERRLEHGSKGGHKTDSSRDSRDSSRHDKHRDKPRHKESSSSSSKDKHRSSDKDRPREKDGKSSKDSKSGEKSVLGSEKTVVQADRDKDTLERIKTPAISSLGKIPRKSSAPSTTKPKDSSSPGGGKHSETDSSPLAVRDRVKNTVKTFNSKFRSTGLEEEVKQPPVSRGATKKPSSMDKSKLDRPKPSSESSSLLGKTHSSTPKEGSPPEKKSKVAELMESKKADKPGGIKLIPPKPKPALLESDMFSDALTASTKIEPRKRKRRTSSSKESGGPDVKKDKDDQGAASPDVSSPRDVKDVKPVLKFYRDTMEDDESDQPLSELKLELKAEKKEEAPAAEEETGARLYPRGVLTLNKRRGPKKSVRWKEESELISIKLFELDETERTNVTRTFVDMKIMERSHEREAFQMARKLPVDDVMEERIPWSILHLVEVPAEKAPNVEPGKNSQEKNVQYAREKTVLQALYFHRSAIPDSPREPDAESHPTTDPKIIPLDDITGNKDSVNDYSHLPWPDPKVVPSASPSSPPHMGQHLGMPMHPGYSTVPGYPQGGPMGHMGNMMAPMGMAPPQTTWRTADGQEVPMTYPQGAAPMCPPMGPMGPMYPGVPEGYGMNGPMGPVPGNYGPSYMGGDPNMYGPPPQQWGRGVWPGPPRGPGPPPMKLPKGVCHQFGKFGKCPRGNQCRFMHPGVNCPPLT